MKRLFALLLAMTMLFVLCACGDSDDTSDDTSSESSSQNSSPENVAKAYVKAGYELDAEGMMNCYPDFYIDYAMKLLDVSNRSQLVKKLKEELEDEEKQSVKKLKAEADHDWYDKDDLENFKDNMVSLYDLTEKQAKKITDLCRVSVTCEVDGDEETETVTCYKYDGKWYVFR